MTAQKKAKHNSLAGALVQARAGPFSLNYTLAAKVGSLVAHADEGLSRGGHNFDWIALRALIEDEDIQAWLAELRALALVPVKRGGNR